MIKTKITLALFILFILKINCQTTYNLKVTYEMLLNFGETSIYNATLFSNSSQSYFEYVDATNEIPFVFFIKTDEKKNKIVENGINLQKKSVLYTTELIPTIDWKMSSETKKINNYTCFKALGNFRGRNYTAWFTPEIPTQFGPFKYHGLPGLVLKIQDDTNEVVFNAKKINFTKNILKIKNIPGDTITPKEKYNLLSNFMDDEASKLISKSDRNLTVKFKTSVKGIEIYDED